MIGNTNTKEYELSLSEPVQDAEEIFTQMVARHAG